MMASTSGSPRVPSARTADSGVPPMAIHTGRGRWTERGNTPRPSMAARRPPSQCTVAFSRMASRSSSFSAEQRVVVGEVVSEQRKTLDERAASRHDLRAAASQSQCG